MVRTDEYRPSVINPEEYISILDFAAANIELMEPPINIEEARQLYSERGAKIHQGIFNCDICGAHYRFGSLFEHTETRVIISIGHECARKMDFHGDSESAKLESKRKGLLARERFFRYSSLRLWARENRCILKYLKHDHPITKNIRERLIANGAVWGITDKQKDLLVNLVKQAEERKTEKLVSVPYSGDERVQIVGKVVSFKVVEGYYGVQHKMVVKVCTEEGNYRLYGSVPSGLIDMVHKHRQENNIPGTGIKGATVSFFAKVECSTTDKNFGFFNRPTKITLLDCEAGQ